MATPQKVWTPAQITEDLRELKKRGEEPDMFALKARYGFTMNSEFFPLMSGLMSSQEDLAEFIGGVISRIRDSRDRSFLHGSCTCKYCTKDDSLLARMI